MTGSSSSRGCSGSATSSSAPPSYRARRRNAIGVVTDLAVGVHPVGADVWTLGDALAHGITVGAPPDALQPDGPELVPAPVASRPARRARLRAVQISMLRTALKHAGGLRIDHVMGLFRLWCIPDGHPAIEGAYLRYDYEALVLTAARGRARRRVRRRRGPRRRRAVRARLPRRARHPRDLDPLVRVRRLDAAAPGELPRAVPRDGDDPIHSRPPSAIWPATMCGSARSSVPPTRPVDEELAVFHEEKVAFLRLLHERGLLADEPMSRRPSRRCTRCSPGRRRDCSASPWPTWSATAVRRTSPAPTRNAPTGASRLGPDGSLLFHGDLAGNDRARRLAALVAGPGAH